MALRVKRHSRDRQGRVSVRRLGLVYTCDEVLRDLRGTSRDIDVLRATRMPGAPGIFKKKNRKEKKDNALNCIILFQIPNLVDRFN